MSRAVENDAVLFIRLPSALKGRLRVATGDGMGAFVRGAIEARLDEDEPHRLPSGHCSACHEAWDYCSHGPSGRDTIPPTERNAGDGK